MYTISFDVGTKNLAYVIMDDEFKIIEWDVVSVPIATIKSTITFLKQKFGDKDLNLVIIEKQPSRNAKMRVFENTLGVFFEMLNIPKIIHYSAKHKLGEIGKTIKGKTNYTLRKKYAVIMCRAFLTDRNDIVSQTFFDSHKKKDDLADCLLQCVSYKNPDMINTLSKCIINV